MCLTAVMMAATAAQAIGSIVQAGQKEDLYDYQARQAEADARAEGELAEIKADKIRKAGMMQQSTARAALAASGVEVGAGTAVKIQQQIVRDAEEDARQEMLYGARSAARLESQANVYDMSGDVAVTEGYTRAAGTLLEGGVKIKSGWVPMQKLNTSSHNPDEWF